MTALPQEIFDYIIEQVGDTATLKSCAAAGTSFRPPCQRALFRAFRVRRNCPDIFSGSPHIASYIRVLSIEMWWDTTAGTLNLPAVSLALRLVQNVEFLIISGRAAVWSRIGHDVQSALFECMARPSLCRLQLSNIHVPPALILWATAIPASSFFHVYMDTKESTFDRLCGSAPVPRLRHLHLPDTGPDVLSICNLLLHPTTPSYTGHIERLSLRIDPKSADYDQRLLTACAQTLTYLALDPGEHINLPHLPLVLEVEMKVFVGYTRQLPTFFASNLSQIASSLPLVEAITLVFVIEPRFPEIDWPDQDPLPILGPSFMSRTQLLHLRRVHCKLIRRNAFASMDEVFRRFVAAMESKMSGLDGTGILTRSLADP
ncbi:hypothetical protein DFH06DRAFT_263102 [Mycena polygramma]|nr:hypothetical protein DFH06DRAFT_263102 [Mycena polygramma]